WRRSFTGIANAGTMVGGLSRSDSGGAGTGEGRRVLPVGKGDAATIGGMALHGSRAADFSGIFLPCQVSLPSPRVGGFSNHPRWRSAPMGGLKNRPTGRSYRGVT